MSTTDLLLHPETERLLDGLRQHPPHAVLLVGEPGIGKTLIAGLVASDLLGSDVAAGNNPYYRAVVPAKNVITIEQIRGLVGFFQLSVPGNAPVKRVAVIQDADLMGHEAQNALLKLLEEPPAGSVLLLTSARATGLLPTIRSRAQQLSLTTPAAAEITRHFVSQGYVLATAQQAVLRHGGNLAAIAAALAEEAPADDSLELVKRTLRGNTYERLLLVDSLAKQKDLANAFADTLATVASASLHAAAGKGSPVSRWQQVLEATHTAQEALSRSGNTKLVLTELMLSL